MPDKLNPPTVANSVTDTSELTRLLIAVAKQDKLAFESFYNVTVDRLFGLALRITQSHQLAEDVLSDVYLQVWRDAEQFSTDRGSVMAWLSVICRSRALDIMRKQQRFANREESLEADQVANNEAIVQDLLSGVEESTSLHAALLRLDVASRQLLSLAYFRGYSHQELAQLTGKPIGTVKTQIRRAIIKLNKIMVDKVDTSGAIYE